MATGDMNTVDYTKLPDFPSLDDVVKANLETKSVEVNINGKTLNIHTEQVTCKSGQPKLDVLFLHGMRFSSKNWIDISSLFHVANWGYRAVAVDLPGYGKSISILAPEYNGDFLKELIAVLGLNRPVIVSPSMSGGFSLPYLFENGANSMDRAKGYVPVAPVKTTEFLAAFKRSELPTLVVCGTNDTVLGEVSTKDLMTLPKATYAPIEGAGHPCYLENPDAFHRLLYDFLSKL